MFIGRGVFVGFGTPVLYIEPSKFFIDSITESVTSSAVFFVTPALTINATTQNAVSAASFSMGSTISISGVTQDVTCEAVFYQGRTISINARTEDVIGELRLYGVPTLVINSITQDAFATSAGLTTFIYFPDNDAFTEYTGFNFNSYARIGANYFAASSSGLYQLGGDTDAGAAIDCHILTAMLDFGAHTMSRVPRAYFDFSGFAGLAVSVYNSSDGRRRTEAFTLTLPATEADRSACLPLSRGMASHFWQYRISNIGGSDLEFSRFAPHVISLSRSV